MNEYICREAILDDLEKEIEAGDVTLDEDLWINKGLRIAIRDIKDIKTADVQPVKHGRWIWDSNAPHRDYGAYKCSDCGYHSDFEENYCCNGGARMDGENNG